MITYNPKHWFGLIFHKYSRDVMRKLLPAVFWMGVITTALTFLIVDYFGWNFQGTTAIHSILGIVLGLFLVFRTNSAYDRWWEGRRAWGNLVNTSRNLALKLDAMLPEGHPAKKEFAYLIPAYSAVLRDYLRGLDVEATLKEINKTVSIPVFDHKPNGVASAIWAKVEEIKQEGLIDGDQYRNLDEELRSFTDILGISERIKNSPIPYSYSMYIKKFIFTFIITLPFAFITHFHYYTVPIVMLLLYILLSVELIAEEIEDPFGGDVNDLPLTALSQKIDDNCKEILLGK